MMHLVMMSLEHDSGCASYPVGLYFIPRIHEFVFLRFTPRNTRVRFPCTLLRRRYTLSSSYYQGWVAERVIFHDPSRIFRYPVLGSTYTALKIPAF